MCPSLPTHKQLIISSPRPPRIRQNSSQHPHLLTLHLANPHFAFRTKRVFASVAGAEVAVAGVGEVVGPFASSLVKGMVLVLDGFGLAGGGGGEGEEEEGREGERTWQQ